MNQDMRSYIAELIGTFTLVFVGTAVVAMQSIGDYGVLSISFAFGFTLMVLVWTIGPVSGCHINPAVTIAMLLAKKISAAKAVAYIIAQVVGGILAALVLSALTSGIARVTDLGANSNALPMDVLPLLLFEVVLTAIFLIVIFSATRDDSPAGFAGLAIGGFLFVAHLVGAQLGDASLNPARSLGPALIQGGDALGDVWIFIVGPIVGAVVGWIVYKLIRAD